MKCNYAVYDEKIYEIPAEVDSQIVEQMIIEQARCSMEQNKHEVIRPTQKVGKDTSYAVFLYSGSYSFYCSYIYRNVFEGVYQC